MTPKEIQAALKNKGTTQKNIALDLGVAEMTVSKRDSRAGGFGSHIYGYLKSDR